MRRQASRCLLMAWSRISPSPIKPAQRFRAAAKLDKKIWVADFIFTNCPGPCPRMSSQMHQVQTALAWK